MGASSVAEPAERKTQAKTTLWLENFNSCRINRRNQPTRKCHRIPREDQIGHQKTVPRGVVQEPVAAAAVIDEDHHHDADPGGNKS
jgi:hypothetical protein